jgi:phytoene synthase
MAINHYENFPVASLLLPAHLRRPIELIYRFARSADDFADEGDLPDARRLALLADYHEELRRIEYNQPPRQPLFRELAPMVRARQLPLPLFHDLLSAFEQDVTQKRYVDFNEVLDYCRRSANPIGRLLLHLFDEKNAPSLGWADNICSALQLINFLQDIEIDYAKGRIYLPTDEMQRFGITAAQIANRDSGGRWRSFMNFQIERCRNLLQTGAPLGRVLTGRVGLELRMTIAGGARILDKLAAADGDMFNHRPVLRLFDWLSMLRQAAWR